MTEGAQKSTKPVRIGGDWWMTYSPTGHPYYHNKVTKETTWTKPAGIDGLEKCVSKARDEQEPMPEAASTLTPKASSNQDHGPQISGAAQTSNGQLEIRVEGNGSIPSPWHSFAQVQMPSKLIQPMLQAGFEKPSPIQSRAWPILQTGRDVIGIAKTGSGKTLGFLMPCFARIIQDQIKGAPSILVMAPTRELAVQIDADAMRFGKILGVVTALAYGGASKIDQLKNIKSRPHLLTGTPGRLNDFLEERSLNLKDVKFLVLDEADRMLDMGFEPQIRKVIAQVPGKRQTMMFTATWPKEVRRLAEEFLKDAVEIKIGNVDELQANADIDQQVVICSNRNEKEQQLVDVLKSANGQAIIFTATKNMCEEVAKALERLGVRCDAIHGDRDQKSRDRALNAFKEGKAKVLVATDVAARGLDVKTITLVVNFDPANNAEDYVHRIGRTGRAGRKGQAITLLTRGEGRQAAEIMSVMQKTGKPIPPDLERLARTGWRPAYYHNGMKGGSKGKGGGKGTRSRSRSGGQRRGSSGPSNFAQAPPPAET